MPASKATQTETAQRRVKAVALKLAGASLEDIATALEYGGKTVESRRAAVSKDLRRAWQAALKDQQYAVEEWRLLELDRLDRLQRAVWADALRGDTKAVHAALAIIAERRRYLPGIEAPMQVDATITETTQADLEIMDLIGEARAQDAVNASRLGDAPSDPSP